MPGFELVGKEEQKELNEIFETSNGVLFAHGFNNLRNDRFRVREFENEFSKEIGSKYSQTVTSGTVAQLVAMKAMGIKAGDEVITQAFTFVATVEAILAIDAVPIIVDVDDSFNMDPKELENAITDKTKLIVPVHMLGNPCDMDSIIAIGKKYNIPILEDACEGLGGSYKGKMLGTLTEAGVFSLDFAKTITTGEGGVICTDIHSIYKYCKEFQDHGHENNPNLPRGMDSRKFYGMNYRMNEMQGAIGLAQIKKLNKIVSRNRYIKSKLIEAIDFNKVKQRTINDLKGDLADTLIFYFETEDKADVFLKKYQAEGYHSKNVPDAIDWHFSGTWNHMFEGTPYEKNWSTIWVKTANLLRRSIALPVYVNQTEEEITRHVQVLKSIFESL